MRELIVLMAGLAMFLVVVSVALPFLLGDNGRSRMKSIRSKREELRKSFEKLTPKQTSLRDKLTKKTVSARISEKLNLKRFFDMGSLKMKMQVAGWRDPSMLPKFLVAHLFLPVILGGYAGYALYYGPLRTTLSAQMRPVAVIAACAIGLALPSIMLSNAAQKRAKKLAQQFPDALDLMLVCVDAGLAVENALLRVTEEMSETIPEVGEEFALTGAELSLLGDPATAYRNLSERTALVPQFKHLAQAMAQSEQYGTAMSGALRTLSEESRKMRIISIEKKAAGIGPKMTIPMILFILPCMFLILIGPTIVNIMGVKKIESN